MERYVGLTSTSQIDGKTIFESEEMKLAIEELDGGDELQRALVSKSKQFASDTLIYRSGYTIQVRSCSKFDCARDNMRVDYDADAKKAAVCVTKPYGEATQISYASNQFGYREASNCEGDPFSKPPNSEIDGR